MLAGRVLAGAGRSSRNVEGTFRHIITDLHAFMAAVIGGIVIPATGLRAGAVIPVVSSALSRFGC